MTIRTKSPLESLNSILSEGPSFNPMPLSSDHVSHWYERVEKYAQEFEAELLKEDEVMVAEVLLSDGSRMTVKEFAYHGPYMAIIYGWDAHGRYVNMCAHYASFQVLFTAVKKAVAGERPKLGFRTEK